MASLTFFSVRLIYFKSDCSAAFVRFKASWAHPAGQLSSDLTMPADDVIRGQYGHVMCASATYMYFLLHEARTCVCVARYCCENVFCPSVRRQIGGL